MKELNITTKTYEYQDGFRFDVSLDMDNGHYEVFLYHKNYGIKVLMYGGEYYQNIDGIEDTIADGARLQCQPYIDDYKSEYMD